MPTRSSWIWISSAVAQFTLCQQNLNGTIRKLNECYPLESWTRTHIPIGTISLSPISGLTLCHTMFISLHATSGRVLKDIENLFRGKEDSKDSSRIPKCTWAYLYFWVGFWSSNVARIVYGVYDVHLNFAVYRRLRVSQDFECTGIWIVPADIWIEQLRGVSG